MTERYIGYYCFAQSNNPLGYMEKVLSIQGPRGDPNYLLAHFLESSISVKQQKGKKCFIRLAKEYKYHS